MRSFICILLLISPAFSQSPLQHLTSLAATERAFAAATRHIGVRDGFLTFFADDAVTMRPAPGPYKSVLRQRSPAPLPLPSLLLWTPTEGDVAAAGDLGWLTGPAAVRENKPDGRVVYTGQYFSVWKKQSDGTWKVLLDAGIETPGATADPETASFAPHALFNAVPDTNIRSSLAGLSSEEAALSRAWNHSRVDAASWYASSARWHADSLMPITGDDAVRQFVSRMGARSQRTLASDCSISGDLGFSYGEYQIDGRTMYYIRVWKFVAAKRWRVVLEWNG